MKKKILAMVLAVTLVLGCASAFAGDAVRNVYNYLENPGTTKVTLECNKYWQWTVPAEVEIDFTKRAGGEKFGVYTDDQGEEQDNNYVAISNIVLDANRGSDGEPTEAPDTVITISLTTVGDLTLKDKYFTFAEATTGAACTATQALNDDGTLKDDYKVASIVDFTDEGWNQLTDEQKKLYKKIDNTYTGTVIKGIYSDDEYNGWGLQRKTYAYMTADELSAAKLSTYYDKKYRFILSAGGSNNAYKDGGYVTAEQNDVLLAVRSNVETGELYKLNYVEDNGSVLQPVTTYFTAGPNHLIATKVGDSVVTGSIQGCNSEIRSDEIDYFCWGTPSYLGTYEGEVTYTCTSTAICPLNVME